MCGIAGIASREPVDRAALEAAAESLRHRGPDDSGIYLEPSRLVGLAHTRLAIIDLSPGGHQPMQSGDGRVTLTFNGEIYNYPELRAELSARGYSFKGHSDTEVLLAGYLAWGTNILDRLNGIFAFAVHDVRNGELFIARDQMGVKPIYYAQTKAAFLFASEIKALLRLAPIDRTLDHSAIRRYLTFLWCPGEQTPFKHIKKLAPGSAIVVSNGEVTRRWTYWRPPQYTPRQDWTAIDCAAELDELLGTCVRRQMISDAPLGAFLSGGIDSSAIVAAAHRLKPDIACFTIELAGGAEEGTTDDLRYARAVAAHLGVSLDAIRVGARTMCDKVVEMVEILDEPLADPACLNVLFISELARSRGIKVLLSGAGGDDLFTGYRRHTLLSFDPLWASMPSMVRRRLARLAATTDRRHGWQRRLARLLEVAAEDSTRRITSNFIWGSPDGVDGLLSADVAAGLANEDVAAPLFELITEAPELPAVERCLMLEKRFFLADHNLIYTDKMAMAAGVEVRVPFLDLHLIGFAATIPAAWKHKFLRPKWILKESQKAALLAEIINRPKAGFGAPLRRWMKGEMQDMVFDLLSRSTIDRRGLFNASAMQRLLDDDRQGKVDASYTLFSAMCIELWCRRFVDEPQAVTHQLPERVR
jgi:asparagine synthase (glutamine-hydrolysing)